MQYTWREKKNRVKTSKILLCTLYSLQWNIVLPIQNIPYTQAKLLCICIDHVFKNIKNINHWIGRVNLFGLGFDKGRTYEQQIHRNKLKIYIDY